MLENNRTIIFKPTKKISLATFSSYIRKITNYIKKLECSNTKDIGNYIRRVLEIICSVENIDNNAITNLNASSKLNALANHLSHESIERILDPLPKSHEYIAACIELIEGNL
jgi:ATP-dependent helicase/DNAse subunit B